MCDLRTIRCRKRTI